jgi:hypothetical protein
MGGTTSGNGTSLRRQRLDQISYIAYLVDFRVLQFYAEALLGRHDDLDLPEAVPARHVSGRHLRLEFHVVPDKDIVEDVGQSAVDLCLGQGFSPSL